jgi:hypothetical protein
VFLYAGRVVERDEVVVPLEVVGADHAVGVVELGHPLLGRRAGTLGQSLRHRREVAAGMVEDAVE